MTGVVSVTFEDDIAWVRIDNPPVNATSVSVRQGLLDAVEKLHGQKLAVLDCAGKTFVAGGDMSEFDNAPAEPHLPDVVQAIENSETPFLALMHGNVLGGGLEIALGCAWRFAAKGTRFGLPEVNVGLIPGAGGTQRLPRLVGMSDAIDIACMGKVMSADEMHALGGIDEILDGDAWEAARAFARNLPKRPLALSLRDVPAFSATLFEEKEAALEKRSKGQQSPFENLRALKWATEPFATGQPKERERHLDLRQSPESRALRHAFFSERLVARPAVIRNAAARDISHIAVVGGGLMGAGIAMACLGGGMTVTLIERDQDAVNTALERVAGLIDGAVKRGKIAKAEKAEILERFTATSDYADSADCDLAIEAVFEDLAVKQAVFKSLSAQMGADAILATNTSYIDPRQIFDGIPNPDRCLGLHFFSPAHVMKLLEIVKMPDTDPSVLTTGFALGKRLRKVSVLSGICDGFIGNRMLAAYRREADYLLADGAQPHQVDAAMRKFGMPMGPYELQDLTGLQIAWANRKRQSATRPVGQRYVPIADQLCELERFGQRSGRGWYEYTQGNRTPGRDPEVEALIETYSQENGIVRRRFTDTDIAERLMAVLANEGALIVNEGIAENTASVDMVKLHGYGFPRWRGGPMQYAREIGWDRTADIMAQVASESPGSWIIADRPDGM